MFGLVTFLHVADEENWRNDYPDHDPWESDPEEEKRYFGDYGFNYGKGNSLAVGAKCFL